ncbi:CRISPR-associated protein Cmr2 [Acetomicrobium thermoterrenum DSM 13490]|uniref:CRISPR-associated protein Cmr2 n=1 Tax=Acetomicrobium thermoterrenum DSM 13490 TaxID=1120987 RepID=A0A1H3F0Y1_9BACT|nr:RAMP superfamily CRISPR-associated protein [Acetomicrobium thermoterrenum]SDX84673.1 CRISPR-associated protein Cmr2 [Acetomicrobium thermoterrenum DSM 13490]
MIIHDYYLSVIEMDGDIKKTIVNLGKKKHEIIAKKSDEKLKEFTFEEDFKKMPKYSMFLEIKFILKRSYTSKGEGEFNVINDKIFENPIVRDKLTGSPMVRPSTWKGHLRFAAESVNDLDGKNINEITKSEIIERLFGPESTSDKALEGRLHFFPTFFTNNAEEDVITPLSRTTRTPVDRIGPITLEVMPIGAEGDFRLLYFPYPRDIMFSEEQVKTDLKFLTEALELMFFTFGFSAKKTSGFGVIGDDPIVTVWICPREQQSFNKWEEFKEYINKPWSGDHV